MEPCSTLAWSAAMPPQDRKSATASSLLPRNSSTRTSWWNDSMASREVAAGEGAGLDGGDHAATDSTARANARPLRIS